MEGCKIPRPDGCVHPCTKRCHLPQCDVCNVMTKTACHCGLHQVYYKCGEFYPIATTEADAILLQENREKKLSCGNRCIKNVSHSTPYVVSDFCVLIEFLSIF